MIAANQCIPAVGAAFELTGCRLNQYRPSRKRIVSPHIINHIDLANVESRLQTLQRHLHLENHRSPVRCSHLLCHDRFRLVHLYVALQKFDARQHTNRALRRPALPRAPFAAPPPPSGPLLFAASYTSYCRYSCWSCVNTCVMLGTSSDCSLTSG